MSQEQNNTPFHFNGSQIHRPSSTEINPMKKDYFSSLFNETPVNSFTLPEVTSPHIPFEDKGDGDMEIVETKREVTPMRDKQAIIINETKHQLAQMISIEEEGEQQQEQQEYQKKQISIQPTKPITMKSYQESSEENYQMEFNNNDDNQQNNDDEIIERKESIFEEFEEMKLTEAALFQQAANMFIKAKNNLIEGTDEILSKYEFAFMKRAFQILSSEMDESISPEELRQLYGSDDDDEDEDDNAMEEEDDYYDESDDDDDEIIDEQENENEETKMPRKPPVEREEQTEKKEKKSTTDN